MLLNIEQIFMSVGSLLIVEVSSCCSYNEKHTEQYGKKMFNKFNLLSLRLLN